jgi:hypothetical protein
MDIHQPCQCPHPDGGPCILPAAPLREWRISAAAATWHGSCWTDGTGICPVGRMKMEKFESFAFAIGFLAAGLLTLAAQAAIV